MQSEGVIQTFWGKSLQPGQKTELEIPDGAYTIITNVCFGEIKPDVNDCSIIKAKVELLQFKQAEISKQSRKTMETTIGCLKPNEIEIQKVNHVFSPLSKVEIENEGPNVVFISGMYNPIEDDSDEEINEL